MCVTNRIRRVNRESKRLEGRKVSEKDGTRNVNFAQRPKI